ncbi:claw keratin-like [Strigops habroptila]|uniref:claw keratin-like n=1 Tax=Strigops habroptila TaxID=2489341 RepID=UPI0011D01738|nr:claw keratin-like [Strigops habroptila]
MSCSSLCAPSCGVAAPCPLADTTNKPCVHRCQSSTVVIQPPASVVTFPGPILSSFPQHSAVGSAADPAIAGCYGNSFEGYGRFGGYGGYRAYGGLGGYGRFGDYGTYGGYERLGGYGGFGGDGSCGGYGGLGGYGGYGGYGNCGGYRGFGGYRGYGGFGYGGWGRGLVSFGASCGSC